MKLAGENNLLEGQILYRSSEAVKNGVQGFATHYNSI